MAVYAIYILFIIILYTGEIAQTNGQVCRPMNSCEYGHYYCDENGNKVCREGFRDPDLNCTTRVINPESDPECPPDGGCNNGYCFQLTCCCSPGWIGERCNVIETPCHKKPCLNGATCIDLGYRPQDFYCICSDGFDGDHCEGIVGSSTSGPSTTRLTNPNTPTNYPTTSSRNPSTTTSGSRCPPNYYGIYCETYCKAEDSCEKGHYSCDPITGAKICHEGWTKDSECKVKSTDPDEDPECPSQGCNAGFCWKGGCCCMENMIGEFCNKALDLCESEPCLNGGNCISSPPSNEYRCDCPPNTNGRNCENDITQPPRTNQWYEFIVGFTSSVKGKSNSSVSLIVSNPNNHNVSFNISSPLLSSDIYRVLGPKGTPTQSVSVSLPGDLQMGPNVKEQKGVHVFSRSTIIVHGMNNKGVASDGFLGIPLRDLGNYYIIPSYKASEESESSNIGIVATVDGTEVQIVRHLPDAGYVSQNISVRLNKLETYQVNEFGSDLTGSIVASNAPVAVFSGASFTSVPNTQCCSDHLIEQIPPVTQWGTSFAIQYTRRRMRESDDEHSTLPNEIYRIIGSEDGTRVLINKKANSNTMAIVNKGTYAEYTIKLSEGVSERHGIFANKPCLVAQYSTGSRFLDFASPFMMIVPPVEQYIDEFVFATENVDPSYNNSLNIVIPGSVSGDDVLLNGNPAARPSQWEIFALGQFQSTQLQLENGTAYRLQHNLKEPPATTSPPPTNRPSPSTGLPLSSRPPPNNETNFPNQSPASRDQTTTNNTTGPGLQGRIAAHVYGHKMGQSYGYPAGMAFNIINALNITIAPPPRYLRCECRVRTEPTPEFGRIVYKTDDILFKDTDNNCPDCINMFRQCPRFCSRNISSLLSQDGLGTPIFVNKTGGATHEPLGQVMCNNYNAAIAPPGLQLATHTIPVGCGEESDALFIQTHPQHRLCCIPGPTGEAPYYWDRDCGSSTSNDS